MKIPMKPAIVFVLCCLSFSSYAAPQKPAAKDKCPVCCMFVIKYPEFLAQIKLTDGSFLFFDGPKDFFIFLKNPDRFIHGKSIAADTEAYVTDYYSQKTIDARKAWYVIGSDILGPMGKELVPFADENEAKEFKTDHGGGEILQFQRVDSGIMKELIK